MATVQNLITKNDRDIAGFRRCLVRLTGQQETPQAMIVRRLAMQAIAALNGQITKAEKLNAILRSRIEP
jgi:hypothetical protein